MEGMPYAGPDDDPFTGREESSVELNRLIPNDNSEVATDPDVLPDKLIDPTGGLDDISSDLGPTRATSELDRIYSIPLPPDELDSTKTASVPVGYDSSVAEGTIDTPSNEEDNGLSDVRPVAPPASISRSTNTRTAQTPAPTTQANPNPTSTASAPAMRTVGAAAAHIDDMARVPQDAISKQDLSPLDYVPETDRAEDANAIPNLVQKDVRPVPRDDTVPKHLADLTRELDRDGGADALPSELTADAAAETNDGGAQDLLHKLAQVSLEVSDRPPEGDDLLIKKITPEMQELINTDDRKAPVLVGYEAKPDGTTGEGIAVLPQRVGHWAAVGSSQSGKSTWARHLLGELIKRGETVIAFLPAKGNEYYSMLREQGIPVEVINDQHPASLAWLEPAEGYSRTKHLERVYDIFGSFAAPGEEGANMLRQSLRDGTRTLLALHGINPETGERMEGRKSPQTRFTEAELGEEMMRRVDKNYTFHPQSIKEYIRLRYGKVSEGMAVPYLGTRRPRVDLLNVVTTPGLKVVDAGSMVSSEDDVGLIMSLWMNAVWETIEMLGQESDTSRERNVTLLIEEAHRMAVGGTMTAEVTKMFQESLGRGVRIGVVEQSLSGLPQPWVANLGMIVGFRQPHLDDQTAISGILPFATSMKEQEIADMAGLATGYAQVFVSNVEGWKTPIKLKTPHSEKADLPAPLPPVRMEVMGSPLAACGELCGKLACENSVIVRAEHVASEVTREMGAGRAWVKRLFDEMNLGAPTSDAPDIFADRYRTLRQKDERLAECLVTELIEEMLNEHTQGIEKGDLPRDLIAATLATFVREVLDGNIEPGAPFNETFVSMPIRVLLAMEAISPFQGHWNGAQLRDTDPAPPLKYPIPGVRESVRELTYTGEYYVRPVTVAERRADLADCDASMESQGNRQIARGILIGDKRESQFSKDLQLLFPQLNWGDRHSAMDELTHNVPTIRSEASMPRIAASWIIRFLQPRTSEAKDPKTAKKSAI